MQHRFQPLSITVMNSKSKVTTTSVTEIICYFTLTNIFLLKVTIFQVLKSELSLHNKCDHNVIFIKNITSLKVADDSIKFKMIHHMNNK